MSVASVSQPGLTPYFWGRVSVGGVSQPAPDTPGCRHAGRGRIPRPKGNTLQRPELHWRRAARLRTSNRLGRSDACAGAWPRTPRLRSTLCACAGLAEAPAEYVRWCRRAETSWVARRTRTYPRTPDTHVPTHAQGKRRVPGAQGRPRAGGREALSVSGRAEGREESPTVAAEGRFYGSHAGPNAAGRRAREPLALRGSPERGRLRVRAAPSAPCGRPAPGAPRDRRPRGSGRRRGEGTR